MGYARTIARQDAWRVRGDALVRSIVGLLVLACFGVRSVWAGGGGVTRFAYGKPGRGAALSVEIDSRWIKGDGYRPVRVVVRPVAKPKFTRDRQVTIVLYHDVGHPEFPLELTTQVIDLPEGAAEVTATIYVQQNRVQSNLGVEFWEGRRELRNVYAAPLVDPSSDGNWSDAAPGILVIDFDVPVRNTSVPAGTERLGESAEDVESAIDRRLPGLGLVKGFGPLWLREAGAAEPPSWNSIDAKVPTFQYLSPYDLPAEWIGLTAVDIGVLGLDDLTRLRSELPDVWRVVEAWLRNGGMLWVTGVGDNLVRLGTLNEALSLSAARTVDDAQGSDRVVPPTTEGAANERLAERESPMPRAEEGWQLVRRGPSTKGLSYFQRQPGYQWVNGRYTEVASDDDRFAFPAEISANDVLFATHDLQFGQVVAWASVDPLAREGSAYWDVIFKRLGVDRWMWSQRHGFSLVRDNFSFWNFLIPGVGLAPVNLFRVVITLFVLLIGPLNYSFLKRWKRLNWMLLTVPLSALLVTFALTNYALFTDGISVKARLRSVTCLDQRVGHAVTWSRQAYFAGIAPAGGLVFPADVAVYPLDYDPIARFGRRGQVRNVVWDERQRLATGYLPSRTTAQLMVQRSGPSSLRIAFREGPAGLEGFTNQLRGQVERLLVVDAAGDTFVAGSVAAGGEGTLQPVSPEDGREWLDEHCGADDLRVPAGVDPEAAMNATVNRWQFSNANSQLADTSDRTSRMEQQLVRLSTSGCPTRSYVAILREGGEVPLGVRSANIKDSRYFVVGSF